MTTAAPQLRDPEEAVLRVDHIVVEYHVKGDVVQAVSGVSFDVQAGETLGLVGESGCGKSTLAKAVMQLIPIKSGEVVLDGETLSGATAATIRRSRGQMQMIFQDPISSLNPRRKVTNIVSEGLDISNLVPRRDRPAIVERVMDDVGLDAIETGERKPHEFSGGQCQRISLARALATDPRVLVCDEPVSALDVSVQAQVMNLLEAMKERYGLTLLFIAHDLAVVKNISDRLGVMYLGKLCEIGDSEEIYRAPMHPYTAALLAAIPDPTGSRPSVPLEGDIPSPLNPPSGCRFRTRCPFATELCAEQEPEMREHAPSRFVACHYPLDAK